MEKIKIHNSDQNKTFRMSMNSFGDVSAEEWKEFVSTKIERSPSPVSSFHLKSVVKVPSSWDWRKKGVVGPVEDQGQCGDPEIITSVEACSSAFAIWQGTYVQLSTQQIIDCGTNGSGCNGGEIGDVEAYIEKAGLETAAQYPDHDGFQDCKYDAADVVCRISAWNTIPSGNETAMEVVVASLEPVIVAIDASQSSFQFYSDGVYSDPNCSTVNLDHMLLNVGYGTIDGSDYWILENSWSVGWGMRGYVLMARNAGNMCGVATDSSYPIVDEVI